VVGGGGIEPTRALRERRFTDGPRDHPHATEG
jgi:hypothetical protein